MSFDPFDERLYTTENSINEEYTREQWETWEKIV